MNIISENELNNCLKNNMSKYYAVAKGRIPGIYRDWPTCQKQVDKFSSPAYKSFKTEAEAKEFLKSYNIPNNAFNTTNEPNSTPVIYDASNTTNNEPHFTHVIFDPYTTTNNPNASTTNIEPDFNSNILEVSDTKWPNELLQLKFNQVADSKKYYIVIKGKKLGIYTNWPLAKQQIDHYPEAIYKSFESKLEASDYLTIWQQNQIRCLNKINYYVYTDGSYAKDNGIYRTGYAYLVVKDNQVLHTENGPVRDSADSKGTNNVGELTAILKALTYIDSMNDCVDKRIYDCVDKRINEHVKEPNNILIRTDSQYSLTYTMTLTAELLRMQRDAWENKNKDIKNFNILKDIIYLYVKLLQNNVNIAIEHIYGHKGHKYNEMVDRLANEGRLMY